MPSVELYALVCWEQVRMRDNSLSCFDLLGAAIDVKRASTSGDARVGALVPQRVIAHRKSARVVPPLLAHSESAPSNVTLWSRGASRSLQTSQSADLLRASVGSAGWPPRTAPRTAPVGLPSSLGLEGSSYREREAGDTPAATPAIRRDGKPSTAHGDLSHLQTHPSFMREPLRRTQPSRSGGWNLPPLVPVNRSASSKPTGSPRPQRLDGSAHPSASSFAALAAAEGGLDSGAYGSAPPGTGSELHDSSTAGDSGGGNVPSALVGSGAASSGVDESSASLDDRVAMTAGRPPGRPTPCSANSSLSQPAPMPAPDASAHGGLGARARNAWQRAGASVGVRPRGRRDSLIERILRPANMWQATVISAPFQKMLTRRLALMKRLTAILRVGMLSSELPGTHGL